MNISTSSLERPQSYNFAVNGDCECGRDGTAFDPEKDNSTMIYHRTDKCFQNGSKQQLYRKESGESFISNTDSTRTNTTCCSNTRLTGESVNNGSEECCSEIKRKQCTRRIILVVLLVIFCVTSVGSLAISVTSMAHIEKLRNELISEKEQMQQNSNTFCLPCNDLRLGPLEEDNVDLKLLIRKEENGKDLCCAKGEKQNSIIMKLLFQRRDKLQQATECTCNFSESNHGNSGYPGGQVTAHLVAGIQNRSSDETIYTMKNWIKDDSLAHANGVEVTDSRIIINSPGSYHLYSQVLFTNIYKGNASANISQTLYHYVYRWNVKYPNDGTEMLLKSVRTQCWAENKLYGDYTSYTSGVFKLNTGDNMYVKVSNIDLVSRDPKTTFFGLAML